MSLDYGYRPSPEGPCHELGGAAHRCDGPPRPVRVVYHRPGRDPVGGLYRWCERAVGDLLAAVVVGDGLGTTVEVHDGWEVRS